ncbi:MAG: chromosomal replication initiator protein DnaA [Kiritimatiellae bacterium]|nr:chromosomal replication initiator protein DnaA [Kiritimatiellia bacterium]
MKKNVTSIWNKACTHLKDILQKDVYDRWIAVIEPTELTDQTLTLCVANDFYQTWLEENYISLIQSSVASVYGEQLDIKLIVDKTATTRLPKEKDSSNKTKPLKKEPRPKTKRDLLNPKYSFDSFIVGPSNHFAHAATMAVAQTPARAYNPLFIYGGVGLGKTHLMQAIGNYVLSQSKANVCYMSSEAFTNDYIDALQRKSLVQFRKKYRNTDLLLIDDIQFLGGKERMQEEFFHTFNALFDSHKQIVLTSDRPASKIPGIEHRLVSRFEWGLVTELEPPDIETRIAILRNKQEQMNLQLPDEVITYIAEHIRSNIRRLEGALIRATSYASLTGKDLSIEVLENLLRDTLDQTQNKQVTMEMIQRTVSDYYDIRLADMSSRQRPQSIVLPRQVAMYLCRIITQHSLPTIGNAFGRNHATILHACRLIENKMKNDENFRLAITTIKYKINKHCTTY